VATPKGGEEDQLFDLYNDKQEVLMSIDLSGFDFSLMQSKAFKLNWLRCSLHLIDISMRIVQLTYENEQSTSTKACNLNP